VWTLLFAIGLDDQVYLSLSDAAVTQSTGYYLTTPGRVREISVTYTQQNVLTGSPNSVAVFARGLDNQVYTNLIPWSGSVSGYHLAARGAVTSIDVSYFLAPDGTRFPALYATGLDREVYAAMFEPLQPVAEHGTGYVFTTLGHVM
jgi:hypothetical protein